MKTHTTNYFNVFIEVAEDCPVDAALLPPQKANPSVAELQYKIISKNPYQYTSDDIIFEVFSIKNDFSESEKLEERQKFFSKGQPCLRCSALAKRYGFGFHHDFQGKVALFPMESKEYKDFLSSETLKKVKAMRSKKA